MLLTLRYLLTFLTVIVVIAVVIYVRTPFSDIKTMARYFFRQKKEALSLPNEEVANLYYINKGTQTSSIVTLPSQESTGLENRDILGRPLPSHQTPSFSDSTDTLSTQIAEIKTEPILTIEQSPDIVAVTAEPHLQKESPSIDIVPLLDLAQIQQNLKKSHPNHVPLAPLNSSKVLPNLPLLSPEEVKANLRHLERRMRLRVPLVTIPEVELVYIQEPEKPTRSPGVVHRLSDMLLAPKKESAPAPDFSTPSIFTNSLATSLSHQKPEAEMSQNTPKPLPIWRDHQKTKPILTVNKVVWGNASPTAFPALSRQSIEFAPSLTQPAVALKKTPLASTSDFLIKNSPLSKSITPLETPQKIEPNYPRFSSFHHMDQVLPSLALLRPADDEKPSQTDEELLDRGIIIEEKLAEFKVKVNVLDAYAGPIITRYEIEPAIGVRGSQIINLTKDLSRALGLSSIRVVETIPGKTCMGLEVPNPMRQMIRFSEVIGSPDFTDNPSKLAMALGKDITGNPVVVDLAKAPHLLVAGTTGSGKSVGVNSMILSLLFKATPDEVRFIMIDPKMLELSIYNDIPHLLAPVVTDMKLAANALNWCVMEMERRYKLLSAMGVRNLAGFNEKIRAAELHGKKIPHPFSLTPETPEALTPLPFIVVVVDEFADLMMTAGKKIEELIARIAQKARAAGIHLILATQRPSVDVITGLIKANIPTRIAFQVSSKIDSRTILDQMGAESLLGQGDMLFLPPGSGYPQRIHGAFVTDEEVHVIVDYLKSTGEPNYIDGLLTGEAEASADEAKESKSSRTEEGDDPLYNDAIAIVLKTRKATISSVQRHLRIGYNRAARMIDQMEADGMVSAMENNGNRTVLAMNRPEQEPDE